MLRLEPRREPSRVMFYLTPFLAVVLTLLAGIVLFEVLRKPPLEAMRLIFIQPLTSMRGLAELLVKGTPLVLIAIGLAVGFRGGVWNIGAVAPPGLRSLRCCVRASMPTRSSSA